MFLLGKRVDTLLPDDIVRLVENKVQENKSLDYKRDLKLNQDKDKKEFLFDMTSMANTEGGVFLFGVEESKDEKGQNTGTPELVVGVNIENFDKLTQQIEDLIKGNTDPVISSVSIKLIEVEEKNVLAIGIAKSYGLPTMVTFNETNKFYRRRNSGKFTVDVYELNQMFMQNQVLKESAENFVKKRIDKVNLLKVFPILEQSFPFFLHVIPYNFLSEQNIDLSNAHNMNLSVIMKPLFCGGWDTMFNVDGFATFGTKSGEYQKITSYDQLFRNGVYEVYTGELFEKYHTNNGGAITRMWGKHFMKSVIEKIENIFKVYKEFKVEPPFLLSMNMQKVRGNVIMDGSNWSRSFLTDEINFPILFIASFEQDLRQVLKTNFDILWQSVAYPHSPDIQT